MSEMDTSVKTFSPTEAALYLEKNFVRQRKLRSGHVSFLAEQMTKNRFYPTSPIAIVHVNNNGTHIVNGQHTLYAIIKSGKSQTLPVVRYHVQEEKELNDLYAHFDIGVTRTFIDSVRTYKVAEKTGLANHAVNKLASAIRVIFSGFAGSEPKFAHEDLIDKVYDWTPTMVKVMDAISPCSSEMRDRIEVKPILSVALVTMRYQENKSYEFWGQVVRDDGLKRDDPRKALNKKLTAISMLTSSKLPASDILKPAIQSKMAAHSWNKFFRDKPLTLIKESLFDTNKPIKIEGTPFDGTT